MYGSKNLGWEVNDNDFSYAGLFSSESIIEKAGGAGTFMWLDLKSGNSFVYLTNYGKPDPFDDKNWNELVHHLSPKKLSNIFYQSLK